jgi:hypothetical protein
MMCEVATLRINTRGTNKLSTKDTRLCASMRLLLIVLLITAVGSLLYQGFNVRIRQGGKFPYYCAGILQQSMGARNRVGIGLLYRPTSAKILYHYMGTRNQVGIGLSYRPARQHRLAKSISWSRFLGSVKV